jgi:hypothetical protein
MERTDELEGFEVGGRTIGGQPAAMNKAEKIALLALGAFQSVQAVWAVVLLLGDSVAPKAMLAQALALALVPIGLLWLVRLGRRWACWLLGIYCGVMAFWSVPYMAWSKEYGWTALYLAWYLAGLAFLAYHRFAGTGKRTNDA